MISESPRFVFGTVRRGPLALLRAPNQTAFSGQEATWPNAKN